MMFGFWKSSENTIPKANSVEPGILTSSSYNPFDSDSDSEADKNPTTRPARRTSSEPILLKQENPNYSNNDWEKERERGSLSSTQTRNNAHKSNSELDKISVQELESYVDNTTKSVNDCLKIAEDIRQVATKTLDTLHHQGEQIYGTHVIAVDIDRDLGKGEKLLNDLGGMFSRAWKPKKTREIEGPVISKEDNKIKQSSIKQREALGLAKGMQKMEKESQDDVLSDLSNILCDLKCMANDMGSELNRHNKALDHLSDDVDELNSRVKGANQRARRLTGK